MDIVYRRTALSWLYYTFVLIFIVFGLLFLVVALGNAVQEGPWSGKWVTVVGFAVAGLSWLLGTAQMWTHAKSYAGNEVRIDGEMFSLHTPAGVDLKFHLKDVTRVRWNAGLRSRLCTIEAGKETYLLDTRGCPSVGRVARLIAERAGKPLEIEG